MKTRVGVLVVATLIVSACAGAPVPDEQPEQPVAVPEQGPVIQAPDVVVSNSILGSVVADILTCAVGDAESMTVVMPLGTDPHDFQPSSEQVAAMVRSELVVVNGLGLEQGLEGALDAAVLDGGNIVTATDFIEPLLWTAFKDDHGHDDHDHGHDDHDHGDEEYDPHFWFDMSQMALVAEGIGTSLASASGESVFADCGVEVAGDIRLAEADVQAVLDTVPEARRVLVTDHEALGYFANRYGFTIAGVVIPGGSTMGAPDSRALAALVRVIQDNDVPAIFGNQSLNPAVLEAIAAEAERDVEVVSLFVESLGGPGSEAESYVQMMVTNASRIAEALRD